MQSDHIQIKDLVKIFNTNTVLDIPDLVLPRGCIAAFLGMNGSGKTTLIKIICGLLYQTYGEVIVFGRKNHSSFVRRNAKFVFESGKGYYPYLSAYENIRYFLGLNRMKYKAVEGNLLDMVRFFDFEEHLHKKVNQLSQGNRQKMSLIINILLEPQILALDEPTNGLDFAMCRYLADKTLEVAKRKNITVLITTHDLNFVKQMNADSYILKKGSMTKIVNKEQIWNMHQEKKFQIEVSREVFVRIDSSLLSMCVIKENETCFLTTSSKEVKNQIIRNYDVLSFHPIAMTLNEIYEKVVCEKNVV